MKRLLPIIFFLAQIWLIGFVVYAAQVVLSEPTDIANIPDQQAIVVLTGAEGRLAAGADLLRKNKGRLLFISGVYPHTTLDQLAPELNLPLETLQCCVRLGHLAADTFGNASEVVQLMKEQTMNEVILVTDDYHMPRAVLELNMTQHALNLTPFPLHHFGWPVGEWLGSPDAWGILVGEFHKYAVALGRYVFSLLIT